MSESGNSYLKFKNEETVGNITYFGAFKDEKFRQVCRGRYKAYSGKKYQRKWAELVMPKCHMLHHFNPFSVLGTFHIEIYLYKPFRAVFHDFFTNGEMSWIVDYTQPQLSKSRESELPDSTIEFIMKKGKSDTDYAEKYSVSQAIRVWFDDLRYLEETEYISPTTINLENNAPYEALPLTDPYSYVVKNNVMLVISHRIETALNINITSRWGATRYLATNYGLSGLVEAHMDPWGYEKGVNVPEDRMELVSSGDIIATFMGWLSSVPGGGGTGFMYRGYETLIKPVKGSAAFWLDLDAAHNEDRRTYHGGCPVLKGHKWILNKWILSFDQWKLWPCTLDKSDPIQPFLGMFT